MTGTPFPSSPSADPGAGPDGTPGERRPTGRLIVQATLAAGLVAALSLVGGSGLLTTSHEQHVKPARAVAAPHRQVVAAPVTTPVRWQPRRTAPVHHRAARRHMDRAPVRAAAATVAVGTPPATAAPSARATTMAQAAPPSPPDVDVRAQPVQRSAPAPKAAPKPAPRKPASGGNGGWASDFNP